MKKILIINFLILIILMLLLEITFRVFFSYNVQGISKNILDTEKSYKINNTNLNYGKAFGVKIFTDSEGYRIKENQKLKNSKDILFVGGSVTFGPAVDVEKTFVSMINENSKFNVRNASVFGTNFENNIEIIKNHKNLRTNVDKIFINFPIDDIVSKKISLRKKKIKKENDLITRLKEIKILNDVNIFIRSKSATYVFIKSIATDPQLNNYIHDLKLYENKLLLDQLESNLKKIDNIFDKKKLFFYSIPYAAQVKTNCDKSDKAEKLLKDIFSKYNYSIFFLKEEFCKENNSISYYLKNDPVHLSEKGHLITFKILNKFIN